MKRGEKQLEIEFRLGEAKEVFYQVTENPNADQKARKIREAWLRGD